MEYDIGDDNYAIPKSAVERIERGAGLTSPSASATIGTSLAAPKVGAGNVAPIAPDNITPERVAQIEASGDKSKLASALVALAIQEQQRGKTDEALAHMERALSLEPESGDAAATFAWMLLKQDRASLAQTYAEDAAQKSPQSAFARKVLALAYYKNDKIQFALEEIKKAKELDPNDPETYYSIGVIDWTEAYQPRMEERAKLGLKPDQPLNPKDKDQKKDFATGEG